MIIYMKTEQAAICLESIGNKTRLEIFRYLVKVGNQGAPVGSIQKTLDIPGSTLSHHIAKLVKADLVFQERISRELICRVNFEKMNQVIGFLTDCCCELEK